MMHNKAIRNLIGTNFLRRRVYFENFKMGALISGQTMQTLYILNKIFLKYINMPPKK